MSDVCTGVFAKRGVVPEDVVALSVFTFAQPKIFLYHHEATTFNDSSKRPSSFYGEYAGRPTSFSIPTPN